MFGVNIGLSIAMIASTLSLPSFEGGGVICVCTLWDIKAKNGVVVRSVGTRMLNLAVHLIGFR
jgi:hypothetical protein